MSDSRRPTKRITGTDEHGKPEFSGWDLVTLGPGGHWIADQQCMIMAHGYLADWQPYMPGDELLNTLSETIEFQIDYGEPPGERSYGRPTGGVTLKRLDPEIEGWRR